MTTLNPRSKVSRSRQSLGSLSAGSQETHRKLSGNSQGRNARVCACASANSQMACACARTSANSQMPRLGDTHACMCLASANSQTRSRSLPIPYPRARCLHSANSQLGTHVGGCYARAISQIKERAPASAYARIPWPVDLVKPFWNKSFFLFRLANVAIVCNHVLTATKPWRGFPVNLSPRPCWSVSPILDQLGCLLFSWSFRVSTPQKFFTEST